MFIASTTVAERLLTALYQLKIVLPSCDSKIFSLRPLVYQVKFNHGATIFLKQVTFTYDCKVTSRQLYSNVIIHNNH